MKNRREFLKKSVLASSALVAGNLIACNEATKEENKSSKTKPKKPVVISTWKHGIAANEAAWKVLSNKGKALDAVEQGVSVSEADPNVTSVGYGSNPDRDGNLTLDASIMDEKGNCGAVGFLQHIMHPISVARKVMEETPHILLVGEGALKFALDKGFKKENLVTEEAIVRWKAWMKGHKYDPNYIDQHNHDTIGMVALDSDGNLSGACTTSGLSWKLHGRVGDSPIIGAGMYVDNSAGAAAATGKGEAVIKIAGSFLVVELMRQGKSPQEACELAVQRIAEKQNYKDFQVGFIALNKNGETGAYSIQKGFQFAQYDDEGNRLEDVDYFNR